MEIKISASFGLIGGVNPSLGHILCRVYDAHFNKVTHANQQFMMHMRNAKE